MSDNELVLRVQEMFVSENFNFKELSREFPELAKYFDGTKPGKINRYDNGVMSVVIEGLNKKIPSTFGCLPKGDFRFNTGPNQETMYSLLGNLSWGIEGDEIIIPRQYEELIIPAGENLILNVRDPSLYICDYSKK